MALSYSLPYSNQKGTNALPYAVGGQGKRKADTLEILVVSYYVERKDNESLTTAVFSSLWWDEKRLHNCASERLMQREARKDGFDGRHGLVHFLYLCSDTCTRLKRKSVKSLCHDLKQPCSSSCPERHLSETLWMSISMARAISFTYWWGVEEHWGLLARDEVWF